jgi:hemolysin activation/secretion protein
MSIKLQIFQSGFILASLFTSLSLLNNSFVTAQTSPSRNPDDRFPQPIPSPQPLPPQETPPVLPTPSPPETEPTPSSVSISVSKIAVSGSTILRPEEIAKLTKPLEGREVTLAELRGVADAITQLYLNQGYISSRAILADQEITNGVVQIRVVEGSLEKIEVVGTQRLNSGYIRDRIKLGASTPLNQNNIEDQLRLLRIDPLFTNVEATLQPGTGLGKNILVVKVTEAPAIAPFLTIDNYSPPSVGSERFGGGFTYRNLTGMGDEFTASYFRATTGGSNAFDLSYRVPINAMNGTIQLRYAPSDSKIVSSELASLGIRADSALYEISYRQPLIRTPRNEFALSLAFTLQDGQTFLFNNNPFPFGIGPDAEGNSRTRVLKFGQDYIKRDVQGSWAMRSQFNFGLGIFDATINSDPIPDGRFFSWQGQIQRVQQLSQDNLLIAQADLQLTPNSLLPSQQFVIGGGQLLRGYRQNARTGDNGFRLSLENRIAIQRNESGLPNLQIAPFIDMGAVWNKDNNPNPLPRQNFLVGAGLGLIWEPIPRLGVRLDYALPLVDLSDRGNNAQDDGFFFSVNYNP